MDAQIGQQMRKLELFYYSNPQTLVLTHLHWFWSGLYVLDSHVVVEAAQEADAEGAEAKREADAFLAKGQALQWMHTKTYLM